jgi:hypothetical protein
MPPRASHLPNVFERTVLQKLTTGEKPAADLIRGVTAKKLLAKGWIEHGNSPQVYRITPAGEAALRAKLPVDKGSKAAL